MNKWDTLRRIIGCHAGPYKHTDGYQHACTYILDEMDRLDREEAELLDSAVDTLDRSLHGGGKEEGR